MNMPEISYRMAFLLLLAAVAVSTAAAETGPEVVVYLDDGKQIRGLLLQVTDSFIKINPGGAITLRTIPGDEIRSLEFVESGRRLDFPLDASEIPGKLGEDPQKRRSRRSNGLRPFGLTFSAGLSSGQGDYYEGIGSGPGFQLGGYYRFSQDDPYGHTFFIGLSYRYNSLGITQGAVPVNGFFVEFDNCSVHQYNLDCGVTTKVTKTDTYLYFLTGLSIVESRLTGHVEDISGTVYPASTYSETQAAMRFIGGVVIGISAKLGIDIKFGWDVLLTSSGQDGGYSDYYYDYNYYDNRDFLGAISLLDVGIVWEP